MSVPARCRPAAPLGLSLLLLTALIACGAGPTPSGAVPQATGLAAVALLPQTRLQVVATTNLIGDVVAHVGGERIDLTVLMGWGVDPHTYIPTPQDMAAVGDAHVLFSNGAGLEEGLSKVLQEAGGGAAMIELSDGLELLAAPQAKADSGHAGGAKDPHVWFDVKNVVRWTETIERTLSTLDPASSSTYQANAAAYTQELAALDAWIVEQVAAVPAGRRKLVTSHLVFNYLAHRYGFEQVGAVYPLSPSSEPSARDIAALEDIIRQNQVSALFVEATINPALSDQVAQDTGVRVVPLYTESLAGPGSGVDTYVDLMRYDVGAIVQALR